MAAKAIVMDPRILSGNLIFRGTRIPVHLILELLKTGKTPIQIVKEDYPRLPVAVRRE